MSQFTSLQTPATHSATPDQPQDGSLPVSLAPWTWDQIAYQLTNGYWGGQQYKFALDASRTLTYNVSGLSEAERAIAVAALEAWSEATGINFVASLSSGADLIFDNNDGSGAYARSNYSGNTLTQSFINIPVNWAPLDLNSYMLQTYIHEIGHALGLGHAGNYNGGATFGIDNLYDNDSWLATVMSYFSQTANTLVPGSYAFLATVMPADIIAIQNLYGFSGATNGGNSVYGYGSNIGGYLQTLLNQWTGFTPATPDVYWGDPIAFTIYDSNGVDTIDFSNFSMNQEISLIQLTYSDIGGLVDNVTIARDVVIENATSGAGNDTLTGNSVNNVLRAGGGNDRVNGNEGNDVIYGGTGNDTLLGGTGNDVIYGELGNDSMEGGIGDDIYFVNSGLDLVIEASGAGTDTVRTGLTNYTLGANVENLVFTSTLNSTGTGNALNNVITGNTGADSLFGLDGFDFLNGGAGNDSLVGGIGADSIYGGNDIDQVFGDAGNDLLYGGTGNDSLYGGDNSDQLDGGEGDDVLTGGIGNDVLIGRAGNDVLVGGDGSDRMQGGYGFDTYTGGAGADRFTISTRDVADLFTDFTSGLDRVMLVRSSLGISGTATLADLWQTGGSLPTDFGDGDAVLFYDATSRTLYLDTDGGSSSNASALFTLQVGGTLALTDLVFG